jgi:hypothetical protein
MNSFSMDTESVFESELIDLGTVSIATLRTLNDAAIKGSLLRVIQRIARPQVTAASEAERID